MLIKSYFSILSSGGPLIANIAFLIIGSIIVVSAAYRSRVYMDATHFLEKIEAEYGPQSVDLSGHTGYPGCFSQEWVLDNVTNRKYGRVFTFINDFLLDNTLGGFMCLALIVFFIPLFLWFTLLSIPPEYWTAVGGAFIGIFVIYGTGGPQMSQELVNAVLTTGYDEINDNDYVYLLIAKKQLFQSVVLRVIIGAGFIMLVPAAVDVPVAFALAIAWIAYFIIWGPVTFLEPISIIFALGYVAAIIPILLVIIGKLATMAVGRVRTASAFHTDKRYPPDVERFREGRVG